MNKTADRWALIFAGALFIIAWIASCAAFARECQNVRENTLRLHIIANSDSEDDQRLKLLVRDGILTEYSPVLSAGNDIKDAVRITEGLTDSIELSAQKILRENGCYDSVSANVCDMYFDTIEYSHGKTMPAGNYLALRLVIGEGKGHNWWCVMYPPLCVNFACKETAEEENILALSANDCPRMKFAVVEMAEKARKHFSKA